MTKSGAQRRAEHLQAQRRLIGEIEIVDRLQKRKVRATGESREPGLLAMRDLLGREQREEVAIGPASPARRAATRSRQTRRALARCSRLKSASRSVSAAIMTGLRRGERMPPCSAASRGSAALRPCGRLRRPGPGLRAAASAAVIVGGRSVLVKRQRRHRRAEIVRDVLGADRLLGEAALEGGAQRRVAVRCRSACRRSTS